MKSTLLFLGCLVGAMAYPGQKLGQNTPFLIKHDGHCAGLLESGAVAFNHTKDCHSTDKCNGKNQQFVISQRGWLYVDGKVMTFSRSNATGHSELTEAGVVESLDDLPQFQFSDDTTQLEVVNKEGQVKSTCVGVDDDVIVQTSCDDDDDDDDELTFELVQA
jgi:hypothetical protein